MCTQIFFQYIKGTQNWALWRHIWRCNGGAAEVNSISRYVTKRHLGDKPSMAKGLRNQGCQLCCLMTKNREFLSNKPIPIQFLFAKFSRYVWKCHFFQYLMISKLLATLQEILVRTWGKTCPIVDTKMSWNMYII